ncbi:MAG: hypothetical protein QME79_06055 [Bacillota bacterium]|nr:hypothetical protein [Bacillota bacterium]
MPRELIPYVTATYTAIFALLVIALVPREDIRKLAIHGMVFGAIVDVLVIASGKLLGAFEYVDHGPLVWLGLPFFAPISWALFFIMYFYFLPEKRPWNYVYTALGIIYSVLFGNLLVNLGIMRYFSDQTWVRLLLALAVFTPWFAGATWGYYRLRKHL